VTEREDLAALLRERSISFGNFQLASGQHSSYYIDARRTTMSGQGQALIGQIALRAIRAAGWDPASVGGLTLGADPIAYAIARASVDEPPLIEAFSVRKSPKLYGTGRRIEGNFSPPGPVVILEDVITTGTSALEAARAVRAEGGEILGMLALVDRLEGGRKALEECGFQVVVITTINDLR
jgi:orotate phosphoribosyltransferase